MIFPKYRHKPIIDPERKRCRGVPPTRLFAGGHSSPMRDQTSPRSGIKGQEGGGIHGWVPSRCRHSWDGVGPMHEKALHRLETSIGKAILEVICETGSNVSHYCLKRPCS